MAKQPDIPLQSAEAQGSYLCLSNEVDDAEGRDREQVGDEATGGKRAGRDVQQGHDERDENDLENARH